MEVVYLFQINMYKVYIFLCAIYLAVHIQDTNCLEISQNSDKNENNKLNTKPCNRRLMYQDNLPLLGLIRPSSLSSYYKPLESSSVKNNVPVDLNLRSNELIQSKVHLQDSESGNVEKVVKSDEVGNANKVAKSDDVSKAERLAINEDAIKTISKLRDVTPRSINYLSTSKGIEPGTVSNANENIQENSLRDVDPEESSDDDSNCLDSNKENYQNRRMSQGNLVNEPLKSNNQEFSVEPELNNERGGALLPDPRYFGQQGVNNLGTAAFRNQLIDPSKGEGVTSVSEGNLLLSQTSQLVCYACSTLSNPTCAEPDRMTTVKYCRKGHEACVKKTYQGPDSIFIVRDCDSTCKSVVPGLQPEYKHCEICHSDLCNGAFTIHSISLVILAGIIGITKYVI